MAERRDRDQVAGFILAGGNSARMGRDKALLELGGISLLERAAKLLAPLVSSVIVIGPPGRYESFGLPVVPDDSAGLGPLAGIATALRISPAPWCLVIACDLPYLKTSWLQFLIDRALASRADVVLPDNELGPEPLCALYHKRCEELVRQALAQGVRKITNALTGLALETVPRDEWKAFDSDGRLFKNMNSSTDYEEAVAYFSAVRLRLVPSQGEGSPQAGRLPKLHPRKCSDPSTPPSATLGTRLGTGFSPIDFHQPAPGGLAVRQRYAVRVRPWLSVSVADFSGSQSPMLESTETIRAPVRRRSRRTRFISRLTVHGR